jgi:hypothetical protein
MNNVSIKVRHFQVIPILFVVAYENTRGELIAVSEHNSVNTATYEALQLNHQRSKAFMAKPGLSARHFEADERIINELGA